MSAGADLKGMRVLILEDETLIAMLLADIVTDLGCEVVGPSYTIEAALTELDAQPVDIALIEITVGTTKSWRVAEKLAEINVPFAFLTGYGEHADSMERFPAAPVQMKPAAAEMIEALLGTLRISVPPTSPGNY
jgi:two-component SAPR family response regulator